MQQQQNEINYYHQISNNEMEHIVEKKKIMLNPRTGKYENYTIYHYYLQQPQPIDNCIYNCICCFNDFDISTKQDFDELEKYKKEHNGELPENWFELTSKANQDYLVSILNDNVAEVAKQNMRRRMDEINEIMGECHAECDTDLE